MLSKKLFRWMHKIALFAIVFASLAPSISHAFAAQNGQYNLLQNSFSQEICSSNGNKVVIKVFTTQGKQLETEFAVNKTQPKNIAMHLDHCPFCGAGAAAATLPANNLSIIALLTEKAQKAAEYAAPVFFSNTYKTPPSQAPPGL
jgi:Protein of unknown function (DUF2946)